MSFKKFKKNGYLLKKNFFTKSEVSVILDDAKKVFINVFVRNGFIKNSLVPVNDEDFMSMLQNLFLNDFVTFQNCGKQIQHLIHLHRLSTSKKVENLLKSLGLRNPVISTRPVVFFNHPSLAKEKVYHTMDFHQDWKSMQGSINSVVLWLPLMNINIDFGALKIVPGSHLKGLLDFNIVNGFGMIDVNDDDLANVLDVQVETGDLLCFSSFLIHSSGDNIMNFPRWSAHFRYNDLDEDSFIDRGFPHPYIYKPIDDLLTLNFDTKKNLISFYER
jgi:phytanoyl-CoA hydroxylase